MAVVSRIILVKGNGSLKGYCACFTAPEYDVSALLPDQHYIGPTAAIANQCQCSTVMYSMMGGCSACQNATIISWASWSAACTSVFVDIFPQDIPAGTSVPGWAFDNVTATGTFDPQAALAETNLPESTATRVQSTQTSVSGVSTSSSGHATSSAAPAAKKSSSNAGAIAGGVVGGVVGLALIALIAFLCIKRSKNRRTGATNGSGSPVLQEKMDPQYQAVPYAPTPMSPPPGGFVTQQQKLYVRLHFPLHIFSYDLPSPSLPCGLLTHFFFPFSGPE